MEPMRFIPASKVSEIIKRQLLIHTGRKMLRFMLNADPGHPIKVLCLGAHSDDIEIGCGGTLLRMIEEYGNLDINWIVFCSNEIRAREAAASANSYLENLIKKQIIINNYRDGFLPYIGSEVKDYFENTIKKIAPDIVFTHQRNDLHQDHRLISDLTWNTFRDHLILEYEIPKFDGDLGVPNFYVKLEDKTVRMKIEGLLKHFNSQHTKHWFTEDLLTSIMRIRGMESGADVRFAEAFYTRKLLY
jgi:LmbE family N-acetylglucosaminyl deacetylase